MTFHSLRDWAHVGVVLCELPTASCHSGSTGVLWVLTGTSVWPSIQDDGGYQSASSLWTVELECCRHVVLWSHREV